MDRMGKIFRRFSLIAFSGHFLSGLIIISFHKVQEYLKEFPIPFIIAIVVIYLLFIGIMWFLNESRKLSQEEELESRAKAREIEDRTKKRQHYTVLEGTLDAINQGIRDRILAMHETNALLSRLIDRGKTRKEEIIGIIKQSEGEKREHINKLFKNFCNTFKFDSFLQPDDPDKIPEDIFKVSFYKVDESGKFLTRAYRAYPHDTMPQTLRIDLGEEGGGAGLAWRDEKIIVMEDIHTDNRWVDFRKNQQSEYASMICVPVIKDVPKDALREVFGVLTVDSRIRRGFFLRNLEKFWENLTYPICNFLVLITENEKRNRLLIEGIERLESS